MGGGENIFQSCCQGRRITKIDPIEDSISTVLEVCALYKKGIPYNDFVAITLILLSEKLLYTGYFIDGFFVETGRVRNKIIEEHISISETKTHYIRGSPIKAKITQRGSVFLSAKKIFISRKGSAERLCELLALGSKKIQEIAFQALIIRNL